MDGTSASMDPGAVETAAESNEGDPAAGGRSVHRRPEGRPGPVLLTLDVDGEVFAVREGGHGGTVYDWLSGPNEGYGFASSGSATGSVGEHRAAIRNFLVQIDPATGYIGDP
jgi:hypothetical protein